jgi:polar amino acid transport system substrate-binding protein
MKKRRSFFYPFILFLTKIFIFCYPIQSFCEVPFDLKNILSRKKIIVALSSTNYPPFFYLGKDRQLYGYDVEIAKDIAKKLGVKLEIEKSGKNFLDVVKLIEKSKADLAISAVSATLSRALTVHFSDPYLLANQCLLLNRVLELKIKNDEISFQHHNIQVAILKNSAYEEFANENKLYFGEKFKNFNFIHYENLDQAVSDVISGKIFALYTDEIHINYILNHKKNANIYVRKKILEGAFDPISIVVNWKNQNLKSWINLYIKRMKQNGQEKFLSQKYLRNSR